MIMRTLAWIVAGFMAAAVAPAEAHTLGGAAAGAGAGFAHPFGGLDHLLAMIAVGVWAAQLGGRAVWAVPSAFVAMMAAGGALGMTGIALPAVELGIVGSVVLVGLLVALSLRLQWGAAAALVGFFALFHGHAHGTEFVEASSPLAYTAGFALATAFLHALGIAGAWMATQRIGARAVRAAGLAVALVGVGLLVA
jgi:urease accessory protein